MVYPQEYKMYNIRLLYNHRGQMVKLDWAWVRPILNTTHDFSFHSEA